MARRANFISAYDALASKEAIEKAEFWADRISKIPFCKLQLSKGKQYRLAEFKTHSQWGASAYDLILFLDIIQRCLGILVAYSAICVVKCGDNTNDETWNDTGAKDFNHSSAVLSLSSYLYEMVSSVFNLIKNKNDVAARVLCRSALEASDYWLAFQNDPDLTARYVKAQEDFDQLWYSELRSQKIASLRRAAVESMFPEDDMLVEDICKFKDEAASDFSTAVHPSYISGFLATFYERKWFPEGEDWEFLNDFPHRRTLIFLIDTCALPISIEMLRMAALHQSDKCSLPIIDDDKLRFGKEGAAAVLHGVLLAMGGVATHHQRFTSKS